MAFFTEDEERSYQELKKFMNTPEFMIKHLMQMAAAESDYSNLDYEMSVEARTLLRIAADFIDANK